MLAAKVTDFRGRPVGDLLLRGRSEALRAFEPLSAEQYEDPSTKSYLEAFAKLEAATPARWRHSQRMLASMPMISLPASILNGC